MKVISPETKIDVRHFLSNELIERKKKAEAAKKKAEDAKKVDLTKFSKDYLVNFCTPAASSGQSFATISTPAEFVDAISLFFTRINEVTKAAQDMAPPSPMTPMSVAPLSPKIPKKIPPGGADATGEETPPKKLKADTEVNTENLGA